MVGSVDKVGDGDDVVELRLRDMQCALSILSRPDGSAVFSQGNTVVMAAVYGPTEGKLQNADTHNACVEVNFSAKAGLPTVHDRLRETIIKQTCDNVIMLAMHPRTNISISIQEMQDFGGLLACCLNASCLALLNCGLPMKCLFAAVNCAIDKDNRILLDPTIREMEDIVAELTFVFDSIDRNIISCSTNGNYSMSQYKECLSKCEKASDSIFKYFKDIVVKYSKTI